MNSPSPSDTVSAVHQLKQEIDTLTEKQADALRMAVYVGMTPDEAQEYDERRQRITDLVQQLAVLEQAL
jgi:endo-1,4-beta-D-glucanase Y